MPDSRDPLLHARDVVVVEAEAAADRLAVGEVEHLRGGQPLVGELEQAADERRAPGWSGAASGRRAARAGRAGAAPRAGRRARRPRRRPRRRRTSRWISGANASMSGHITITSRGSSVGSSASRCRIASRSTSTWRARPWQAWTWMLRSSPSSSRSSSRPGSGGPGGGRSSRTSAWMRASSVRGRGAASGGGGRASAGGRATSCSSRDVLAPRGEQPVARQLARRVLGAPRDAAAPAATRSHSAGDGCSRNRWTSRAAASASQHLQPPGRQPREAEHATGAPAASTSSGSRAQARARRLDPLRRVGLAGAGAQPPPQLRLPARVGGSSRRSRRRPRRPPRRGPSPGAGARSGRTAPRCGARSRTAAPGATGRRCRASRRGGRRGCAATARAARSSTTSSSGHTEPLGQPRVRLGLDPRRRPRPPRRRAAAATGTSTFAQTRRRGRARRPARSRAAASASAPCRASAPRSPRARTGPPSGSAQQRARGRPRARRPARLGGGAASARPH